MVRGLIPAHAGKTQSSSAWSGRAWAHPRSRGENTGEIEDAVREAGSSPLTRGKLTLDSIPRGKRGLIPAHAGKTRLMRRCPFRLAAHPRSRGENRDIMRAMPADHGSSPLTRGKPAGPPRPASKPGLIPAHAGKTRRIRYRMSSRGAHPRSRGENATHPDEVMNALGSSPLTRGKLPRRLRSRGRDRLIPAHAGKTLARPRRLYACRAHPRSRGENQDGPRQPQTVPGSSPLTRGKP